MDSKYDSSKRLDKRSRQATGPDKRLELMQAKHVQRECSPMGTGHPWLAEWSQLIIVLSFLGWELVLMEQKITEKIQHNMIFSPRIPNLCRPLIQHSDIVTLAKKPMQWKRVTGVMCEAHLWQSSAEFQLSDCSY